MNSRKHSTVYKVLYLSQFWPSYFFLPCHSHTCATLRMHGQLRSSSLQRCSAEVFNTITVHNFTIFGHFPLTSQNFWKLCDSHCMCIQLTRVWQSWNTNVCTFQAIVCACQSSWLLSHENNFQNMCSTFYKSTIHSPHHTHLEVSCLSVR